MATINRDQFDRARLRRSQEDLDAILTALATDGTLSIEDGGDPVGLPTDPIVITVDDEEEAAEPSEAEQAEFDAAVALAEKMTAESGPGVMPPGAEDDEGEGESASASGEEKLPGTHDALDAYAAERGIDLGDATTVAEKQEAIRAAG